MRKVFFTLATALMFALASCGGSGSESSDTTKNSADSTANAVKISLNDFNSKASEYVDKTVEISGIVDHVCKHGGKRLFLVADGGDVHVDGEERFDETLAGSEISVKAIVREERIDEAYLLKWEQDAINQHSEGAPEDAEEKMAKVRENIKYYRDSMATAKVDHLSFYNLEYISHTAKK